LAVVELPAGRTALLIVDMQNDFVKPSGKLYVSGSEGVVGAISRLVERARRAGVLVAYTMDTHYPGDPEFAYFGEHCVKGSWGWRIVDELAPRQGDVVVEKPRFDAFYSTMLDDVLRSRGIEYIVVTGTVGHICVLASIAGAFMRGYRVVAPLDAIVFMGDESRRVFTYLASKVYMARIVEHVDDIVFKG